MEGAPPVANQIDLFMHFFGASRDGLVARRVDLDTISSSECSKIINAIMKQKLRLFAINQTSTSLQWTYNLNPRTT
jgi:hypothetical protein